MRLGIILSVALVHGLLYNFLMPPWQHYDEPTNFEYAWLLANRPGLPGLGDYDPEMRREVAASMLAHGFFRDLDFSVDLEVEDQPIWIGMSQLNDPPLYYLLVALPLSLLKDMDVTTQLYVGRLVSLSFYLLTIWAAWGLVREITRPQNPLRWILPATVALMPGFAELMSAVNNDAAAVAFFSLFLWGGVRLIKRGFSWFNLFWIATAAAACYLTKSSAYIALFLAPLALIFGLTRGKWRWIGWSLAGAGLVVGLAGTVSWGDAATWYRASDQENPARAKSGQAVVGDHVLQVQTRAEVSPRWYRALTQPVPPARVEALAGKPVTLGVWMWASEPVETTPLSLNDGVATYGQKVALGTEPNFYAFPSSLNEDVWRLWVTLGPGVDPKGKDISIYYDGLILAEGEHPQDIPPQFTDTEGKAGMWGGQAVINRLRNGSGEIAGPGFRPWVEKIVVQAFPSYSSLSYMLHYLLDWQGADWHYWMVGGRLFRTFWGKFGWGNVPLLGHKPYRILLGFTILGLVGATLRLYRLRRSTLWTVLLILALSLVGIWMGAFVRGVSLFTTNRLWIPVARYAYPAIIPTALILAAGWVEVLGRTGGFLSVPKWAQHGAYLALLVALDVWSVVSIISFYS